VDEANPLAYYFYNAGHWFIDDLSYLAYWENVGLTICRTTQLILFFVKKYLQKQVKCKEKGKIKTWSNKIWCFQFKVSVYKLIKNFEKSERWLKQVRNTRGPNNKFFTAVIVVTS
jgi:hypothetical protein